MSNSVFTHHYVSLSGATHFLLCLYDREGNMAREHWELKDCGQAYHHKRNPFVYKERQRQDIYGQIRPYVEVADTIIKRSLDTMAKALRQSKESILALANHGVGITPWYYRQRLYKGLFNQ